MSNFYSFMYRKCLLRKKTGIIKRILKKLYHRKWRGFQEQSCTEKHSDENYPHLWKKNIIHYISKHYNMNKYEDKV